MLVIRVFFICVFSIVIKGFVVFVVLVMLSFKLVRRYEEDIGFNF